MNLMKEHGWSPRFKVDILDADGDLKLDIPLHKIINKNYVGKHILNYDSILVLSHFKGHPMGGYGGALKQLSIGFASSFGKNNIHSAGTKSWTKNQDEFLEAMADAAKSMSAAKAELLPELTCRSRVRSQLLSKMISPVDADLMKYLMFALMVKPLFAHVFISENTTASQPKKFWKVVRGASTNISAS